MHQYKIVKAKTLNENYKKGFAIIIYKDNEKIDISFYKNRKDTINASGALYLKYQNITQIYK